MAKTDVILIKNVEGLGAESDQVNWPPATPAISCSRRARHPAYTGQRTPTAALRKQRQERELREAKDAKELAASST